MSGSGNQVKVDVLKHSSHKAPSPEGGSHFLVAFPIIRDGQSSSDTEMSQNQIPLCPLKQCFLVDMVGRESSGPL